MKRPSHVTVIGAVARSTEWVLRNSAEEAPSDDQWERRNRPGLCRSGERGGSLTCVAGEKAAELVIGKILEKMSLIRRESELDTERPNILKVWQDDVATPQ